MQQASSIDLSFDMNVEEANLVLKGLGKLPFEQVASLIQKLQLQASAQLAKPANSAEDSSQSQSNVG